MPERRARAPLPRGEPVRGALLPTSGASPGAHACRPPYGGCRPRSVCGTAPFLPADACAQARAYRAHERLRPPPGHASVFFRVPVALAFLQRPHHLDVLGELAQIGACGAAAGARRLAAYPAACVRVEGLLALDRE